MATSTNANRASKLALLFIETITSIRFGNTTAHDPRNHTAKKRERNTSSATAKRTLKNALHMLPFLVQFEKERSSHSRAKCVDQ